MKRNSYLVVVWPEYVVKIFNVILLISYILHFWLIGFLIHTCSSAPHILNRRNLATLIGFVGREIYDQRSGIDYWNCLLRSFYRYTGVDAPRNDDCICIYCVYYSEAGHFLKNYLAKKLHQNTCFTRLWGFTVGRVQNYEFIYSLLTKAYT